MHLKSNVERSAWSASWIKKTWFWGIVVVTLLRRPTDGLENHDLVRLAIKKFIVI
jgi:hypothetical protein